MSVWLLTVAFFALGFRFWFYCKYTYNDDFDSITIFYMLIAMAIFHNSTNNIAPKGKNLICDRNATLGYWAVCIGTAVVWFALGESYRDTKWGAFLFRLSWSALILFAAYLGQVYINLDQYVGPPNPPANGPKDLTSAFILYYKAWVKLLHFVTIVRVL